MRFEAQRLELFLVKILHQRPPLVAVHQRLYFQASGNCGLYYAH
jgi:hypothetical protein